MLQISDSSSHGLHERPHRFTKKNLSEINQNISVKTQCYYIVLHSNIWRNKRIAAVYFQLCPVSRVTLEVCSFIISVQFRPSGSHGLWVLLRPERRTWGCSRPGLRSLWPLWQDVQLHQQAKDVCGLCQRLLLLLPAGQGRHLLSVWSPQQEAGTQGGADEAQSEGPATLSHQEEDQHQVLRRLVVSSQ